jgi:hypothetical protein
MDGWQHSAVRAILENPRYTGYAIHGWRQKVDGREDRLADGMNEWIAGLFGPQNLDQTVAPPIRGSEQGRHR